MLTPHAAPPLPHTRTPRIASRRALPRLRPPRIARGNRALQAGLLLLATLLLLALALPPLLVTPAFQHYDAVLQAPTAAHPLGTDALGRDLLSRLAQGARISLLAAFGSQALALLLGVGIGSVAAMRGGRWDGLLMRLADATLAFPALLLVVVLQSALSGGVAMLLLVIALTTWPLYARLARAQILVTRSADYVLAARATGAAPARLLWSHLLPSARPALLVAAAFAVPQAVFLEASLGFLGLGAAPPTATWGGLIRDAYDVILVRPQLIIAPVLAVTVLTLAAALLAAGLTPPSRPRSRQPR